MLKKILHTIIISFVLFQANAQTKVTFRVNMKYELVSPDGVHVPGNFQLASGMLGDWDPSDSLVEAKDPDNDKIYELTVKIPPGNYEYMFVNSNSWIEGSETVPDGCKKSGTDFRELIVGSGDIVLNVVCFSSCSNCPAFMERNVTLMVVDSNSKIKDVKLKGNMSDWNNFNAYDDGTNGDKKAGDHIFTSVYKLKKGSYQWNGTADGFELVKTKNLSFTVDSAGHIKGDTVYRVAKFGSLIDVTFNIDMSKENVSKNGVFVSGDFMEMLQIPIKNWTTDTLKMLPRQGDSLIYTLKLKMYAAKFAWKVWNGNDKINPDTFSEKYNFTIGGCGEPNGKGGYNRISNLAGIKNAIVLKTFLFNSCNISASITDLENSQFVIYPNPANDKIFVKSENNSNLYKYSVSDLSGRIIYNFNDIINTQGIDISHLNKGVYFLKIEDKKGVFYNMKFLKI